jgi:hypothetical protein
MADDPAALMTGLLLIVLVVAVVAFIGLAIWSSTFEHPEDFTPSFFHGRNMDEEDGKGNSNSRGRF